MRWWCPFLVEWIRMALILNILNRKVSICRVSSPSIGLQAAGPDFIGCRYPFVVEWKKRALILNILNRKVSICRDFLSLYRSTGGTPRLHEMMISIFSWLNKDSAKSKYFKPKVFICRDFLSLYRSTGGFHGMAHSLQVITCTKSDLTRCRLRLRQ